MSLYRPYATNTVVYTLFQRAMNEWTSRHYKVVSPMFAYCSTLPCCMADVLQGYYKPVLPFPRLWW